MSDSSTAVVDALLTLAETDLGYADCYLQRAEALMLEFCPRERWVMLSRDHQQLEALAASLRHASQQGDWPAVRAAAHRAAALRTRLDDMSHLLHLGSAVYGSPLLRTRPAALALAGVVTLPSGALERERAAVLDRLRFLVRSDPDRASLYRSRLAYFETWTTTAHGEDNANGQDVTAVRRLLVEALDRRAFLEVEHLAEALQDIGNSPSRAATAIQQLSAADAGGLDAPFPPGSVERAAGLGLRLEALPADSCIERCLAAGERGTGSSGTPLRTGGPLQEEFPNLDPCSGLRPSLVENLLLLLRHPFLTSAGRRYLPTFDTEQILVESFPETEADARTPLLDLLGLSTRRGLSRIVIEDAILRFGGRVALALRLDPLEFTVACIPFDAYLRLADRHGWGRQNVWTHFDGYQLVGDCDLRALVGGDTRYGGPSDFCSVGRSYGGDHLTARFTVVRRRRLLGGRDGR